jgi:hypothetical protein
MIRNVALTLVPANTNTGTQIVPESVKKAIFASCQESGASMQYADTLMKSLDAGATAPAPKFIEVAEETPLVKVLNNVKEIHRRVGVVKALTAGYGSAGTPASRVGGAALMDGKVDGKLKSTTFGSSALKGNRQGALKSLIRRTKELHPKASYKSLVKAILTALSNHNK